jgi:hypothetical protein
MKSGSKFLLLLLALLLALMLYFKLCQHPEPPNCACTPPVPTFTVVPGGIYIQADTLGGNAEIKLRVSSVPGNVTILTDTIQAGQTIFVAIPGNNEQARIQMDYLDPSLRVCPVDVIIQIIIVMDILVELVPNDDVNGKDCIRCLNQQVVSTSNPTFTVPIPTVDKNILNLKIDGNWVSINYKTAGSGKINVHVCGNDLTASESGTSIIFKRGRVIQYYMNISVNDSAQTLSFSIIKGTGNTNPDTKIMECTNTDTKPN